MRLPSVSQPKLKANRQSNKNYVKSINDDGPRDKKTEDTMKRGKKSLILEIFSRLTNFPNKKYLLKKTSPQFHLHLTVLGP